MTRVPPCVKFAAGVSSPGCGAPGASPSGVEIKNAELRNAAARLKLDPAVVASPALTTIVDITGLLIFFTTAKAVLGV